MRSSIPLLLLCAFLTTPAYAGPQASTPTPAKAQKAPPPTESSDTNRPTAIPFLEGTDVFWTVVKRDRVDQSLNVWPNKLEANIFPHLFAYQNFTGILNIDEQADRAIRPPGQKGVKEWSIVFSGTPAVRIRMLQDRSAPVRTPSYMPRGNLQLLRVRGLKDGMKKQDGTAKVEREHSASKGDFFRELRSVERVSVWELHVIGGHHSNGQDGCLSKTQHLDPPDPDPAATCVPEGVVPTAETMNRVDGSFSSLFFFRFGGAYSKNWLRNEPTADQGDLPAAFAEARLSLEYEWHPRQLVDEAMRDIYGRHRVNVGGAVARRDLAWCARRFEVSAGVTWNPGVVDDELVWSGSTQVSCFPWTNGGWGVFARWYAGQDYYNVGFLDDINRMQVGITFNQGEFFRFRRRSGPDVAPSKRTSK